MAASSDREKKERRASIGGAALEAIIEGKPKGRRLKRESGPTKALTGGREVATVRRGNPTERKKGRRKRIRGSFGYSGRQEKRRKSP